MLASSHPFANRCEQFEVSLLPGPHRVSAEVRNDSIDEQREAPNLPLQRSVAPVWPDGAAIEVPPDVQQHFAAIAVLADRDARPHLPPDRHGSSRRDRYGEASLSVDTRRCTKGDLQGRSESPRMAPAVDLSSPDSMSWV